MRDLSGLFILAIIALLQPFMRRERYMIGNTLGVVIGVGIYSLVKYISGMKRKKRIKISYGALSYAMDVLVQNTGAPISHIPKPFPFIGKRTRPA